MTGFYNFFKLLIKDFKNNSKKKKIMLFDYKDIS